MIAQVAESKHLNAVFDDLLDPEGSEIYLKPAGDYVALGQAVPFAAVIEAARRRGEIAFGYRIAAVPRMRPRPTASPSTRPKSATGDVRPGRPDRRPRRGLRMPDRRAARHDPPAGPDGAGRG